MRIEVFGIGAESICVITDFIGFIAEGSISGLPLQIAADVGFGGRCYTRQRRGVEKSIGYYSPIGPLLHALGPSTREVPVLVDIK